MPRAQKPKVSRLTVGSGFGSNSLPHALLLSTLTIDVSRAGGTGELTIFLLRKAEILLVCDDIWALLSVCIVLNARTGITINARARDMRAYQKLCFSKQKRVK